MNKQEVNLKLEFLRSPLELGEFINRALMLAYPKETVVGTVSFIVPTEVVSGKVMYDFTKLLADNLGLSINERIASPEELEEHIFASHIAPYEIYDLNYNYPFYARITTKDLGVVEGYDQEQTKILINYRYNEAYRTLEKSFDKINYPHIVSDIYIQAVEMDKAELEDDMDLGTDDLLKEMLNGMVDLENVQPNVDDTEEPDFPEGTLDKSDTSY